MSSINPKSLCNLARIDTSNDSDWSDLEGSLGSSHSQQRRRSSKHTIEVIPSTPNGGYLADDEIASLGGMNSLLAPSSTESIEEPFASLVISISNLDTQSAEEWETTLQDSTTTTKSTTDTFDTHSNTTGATNNNTTNVAASNSKTSSLNMNHTASKPSIRPRVSAFDKENLTQIPLRRCIGHRRVSFNNLPSPKDLEDIQEQGVEMSYTTTTTATKKTTKQPRPKKKWTHRRPKVLNATNAFR